MKLENTHRSYFDCLEDCFTSVVHYYKRDYMYLFAEKWRVNENVIDSRNTISEILYFCDYSYIVDKYCGLKSDIRNFYKQEYLEEYLIQCIKENKPIIISVDMFDLPWSEFYEKIHSTHFAIIFNYVGDHLFTMFDVTKQIDAVTIDIRKIFDKNVCTIVLSEQEIRKEIQTEEVIKLSKETLRKDVEEKKGYDVLYLIADYFFKEDHAPFQLPMEEVESEIFMRRILFFGRQRLSFAEFLKHVARKTGINEYEDSIADLENIGAKWLTFRNKVMKTRLKGNFSSKKEELRTLWFQLIEQDKAIYQKYINKNTLETKTENKQVDILDLTPYVIDIKEHFNSNAFNSTIWNNSLGFDSNGYFYEMEEENIKEERFPKEFHFYVDRQLDNMSCNGQIISVRKEDVKAIRVIGCCENGDFSEELSIHYDCFEESVNLLFSDWWECDRFKEEVVKKLNCFRITENGVDKMGKVYILSQLIYLQKGEGKMLESIKIPECSNIHIFGMIVYS